MGPLSVAWLRVRLRERLREKPAQLRELRDFGSRAYVSKTPKTISLTAAKNTRNRATRVTTRVFAQPLALPVITSRNHTMSEKKKAGGLRQEMPDAAELMDQIRKVFGHEWADQALREGMRLQREHARRITEHGQVKADIWLDAQRALAPTLLLKEGDRQFGAMPGRRPAR